MSFQAAATVGRKAAAAIALLVLAAAAQAQVVISQVYGGGGNSGAVYQNDFVELYNRGSSTQSLAGWSLQYTSATGTSWGNQKVTLSGSIPAGGYVLVQLASGGANGAPLPAADASATFNMSATAGKLALLNSTVSLPATTCPSSDPTIVDLVGYGGTANCFEGTAPAPTPSATLAILRNNSGCADSNANTLDFAVGTPTPRNATSPPGTCGVVDQPIATSCPASLLVATGAVVTVPLAASDTDSVVDAAVLASGPAGVSVTGFAPAAGVGGSATVQLAFGGSTPAGSSSATVQFSNSTGQTASCIIALTTTAPPGAFTPIYTIQGSGTTSPRVGTTETTRGVVTRVNNNGFYLQDPVGDGSASTSDGIFVFTGSRPFVAAGSLLYVTGPVVEFNTGAAVNPVTTANPLTEVSFPTAIVHAGTGTVAPTPLTLPLANAGDWERYEGMLVRIDTPLVASQNFFQGRYGQVTLAGNQRLRKPTNLHRPGTMAAVDLAALNARNSVMLDDGTSVQNPNPTPWIGADDTLRAGDTLAAGLVGVIDYGLATNDNEGPALYRIHPTGSPTFTRANVRTAAPAAVGGNVKVASFNVLNFFTTFGDGTNAAGLTGQTCTQGSETPSASLCRGADSLAEFTRQRTKIVEAMAAVDADVFGLMEIQNNGNVAVDNLVAALNARVGSTAWAALPLPAVVGTDAIRVAMIYKPARVSLVGGPVGHSDPVHNRPPLAQTFALPNGERFSVIVNHFKSKGCDGATGADLDQGDGQGCFNDRRVLQAQALLAFAATVQATAGDDDVLVIGDINAYAQEDPVHTLLLAGYVDQAARFEPGVYSYVFDGEAGSLDHALASPSLNARVAGATVWHINADEPSITDYNLEFRQPACPTCGPDYYSPTPYRASDHDPVIVGLDLQPPAAPQTIDFTGPGPQSAGSAVTLTASATSGLPVSFGSLTPAVCTVSGDQATLLAAGTCTVTADQAGNAQFLPAPQVQRSFGVALAQQTIDFPQPADAFIGGGSVAVVVSASSGLPVTLQSLTSTVCTTGAPGSAVVTLLGAGTCTLRAEQGGNVAYAAAAAVQRSFAVQSAPIDTGREGDVPLPPWALGLLGAVTAASLWRRSRAARGDNQA
jgi:hypothetical protein